MCKETQNRRQEREFGIRQRKGKKKDEKDREKNTKKKTHKK